MNLQSYQLAVHKPTRTEESDDEPEKEYAFFSYIKKIVDAVKVDVAQFFGDETHQAIPLGLNVRTPFKQLSSDIVHEILVKLGTLLKVEIASRKVKTVSQRVVNTAISAFIILSNLEPVRETVIAELDNQYEEYKVKREDQSNNKQKV